MPWLLSFYVCRILIRKGMTKLRQIMQIAWENKCIVILSLMVFQKLFLTRECHLDSCHAFLIFQRETRNLSSW